MTSFPTVAKLLAERLDVQIDTIQPTTELQTLGADSLTVIELIFDLEDEFGVKLGDERPDLVVVQDIADFIDRYVSQKAAQG
ncbi:phosphopantetheine-binding protein [Undibacterium sp. TJN25]|uniref:phosphopantetheine-binding protein n=1 Tax=Undibacterium sp. TJN25 TaxID=3413056 RepID=UPI003BF14FE2